MMRHTNIPHTQRQQLQLQLQRRHMSYSASITTAAAETQGSISVDPITSPATYALEMQILNNANDGGYASLPSSPPSKSSSSSRSCSCVGMSTSSSTSINDGQKQWKLGRSSRRDCSTRGDSRTSGQSTKRQRITRSMIDAKNFPGTVSSSSWTTMTSVTAQSSSLSTSDSSKSEGYRRPFDMSELVRVSKRIVAADSLLPFPIIEWDISDDEHDIDDGDNDDEKSSSSSSSHHSRFSARNTVPRPSSTSQTHEFLERFFSSATDFGMMPSTLTDSNTTRPSLQQLFEAGRERQSSSTYSCCKKTTAPSSMVSAFASAPLIHSTASSRLSKTQMNKSTNKPIQTANLAGAVDDILATTATLTTTNIGDDVGATVAPKAMESTRMTISRKRQQNPTHDKHLNRCGHLIRSIVWESSLSLLVDDFDEVNRNIDNQQHGRHQIQYGNNNNEINQLHCPNRRHH